MSPPTPASKLTVGKATASKTIKNLHRKTTPKRSLKAFARELQQDKQSQEIVTAWLSNKSAFKKARPEKPKPVPPKPAHVTSTAKAQSNVLRKR